MDRFLLAENPMNTGKQYIVHTVRPKLIIEAVEASELPEGERLVHSTQHFRHTNSDGFAEDWILRIVDAYDDSERGEQQKLLDRAWRWFRSYMEWEDANIDEGEDAQWN